MGRPGTAPSTMSMRASFSTRHGGLCFLLNLALAARLYGDFTRPRQASLALSPWGFLHATGRRLLGRDFRDDPLATWLAARGGPECLPAAPRRWWADAAWLSPFEQDRRAWHVVLTPQRLRVLHPAGFIVAQAPADTPVQELLAPLPPCELVWHRSLRQPRTDASLLSLFWPWLGQRLALSLGLPEPKAALALVLNLTAQVSVRGERCDLHFDLAALPLRVRLAGLDRDPGWIPAAGCDFRFHFD